MMSTGKRMKMSHFKQLMASLNLPLRLCVEKGTTKMKRKREEEWSVGICDSFRCIVPVLCYLCLKTEHVVWKSIYQCISAHQ
mmetsp:Transcript_6533/g.15850  ORF Transcript_6533/g.15850 Transcript_6533/m.15850 type:complete len:82 (-) Transcript_6533:9-254(-)